MIAVCVRWIMLLSFAAHAALGCCIHHQHALSHCQMLKSSEDAACQVPLISKAKHCSCHHSHWADVPATTTSPDVWPVAVPVPGDDCDCGEASCSFLMADSSAGQLGSTAPALSLDYIDWATCGHRNLASANIAVWRTDAIHAFVPLRQLCSWQNSWQL